MYSLGEPPIRKETVDFGSDVDFGSNVDFGSDVDPPDDASTW